MALTLERLRRHLPESWTAGLSGGGVYGLGYDVATSDATTANPSALVVRQQVGSRATEWLVLSWKTRNDKDSLLILDTVVSDLCAAGCRPRRMCMDNSSERMHFSAVRSALRGKCPVIGVAGNEVLKWDGEEVRAKQLLGTLYVTDYDDGLISVPRADFLKADRRLVQYFGGSFTAEVDAKGRHADTFDAGKLAKWACIARRGGQGSAKAPPDSSPSSFRHDARATALHPSVRRSARGRRQLT